MRRCALLFFCLSCCQCANENTDIFDIIAIVDVGLNPHQIIFSDDGALAYIAVAGSDRVAVVDVETLTVLRSIDVPDAPLGVALLPDGGIAATRFAADEIVRFGSGAQVPDARVKTGGAPSLLSGPLPSGELLVSVEQSDLLWLLDPAEFSLTRSYDVGDRPFPPAATSDGRLVFVPNYNDGTVTIIDLWNDRVVGTTSVGANPSGGVVLPDDIVYAVAVRGEDKILFINTASFEVVDSIVDGIGDEPFSVVVAPNGRLAFVNNVATHDVSVIDVAQRRVITRISVGEQPIVMAVHPRGNALWVSSEGSDELTVLSIPDTWQGVDPPEMGQPAEVAVIGGANPGIRNGRSVGTETAEYQRLLT